MTSTILSSSEFQTIAENIDLCIGNALQIDFEKGTTFNMIYFDPPFNSDREYTLTQESSIGFSDKWTDETYERFITEMIDRLYPVLANDGTLFFHISSSCMFIPEKVLRAKFRFVEPIFWKKCRSKNNVKHKTKQITNQRSTTFL